MSEIRVNIIKSQSKTISISGITTFSGSNSVIITPVGTIDQRPSSPSTGQIRGLIGEVNGLLEYYDGTNWNSL